MNAVLVVLGALALYAIPVGLMGFVTHSWLVAALVFVAAVLTMWGMSAAEAPNLPVSVACFVLAVATLLGAAIVSDMSGRWWWIMPWAMLVYPIGMGGIQLTAHGYPATGKFVGAISLTAAIFAVLGPWLLYPRLQ